MVQTNCESVSSFQKTEVSDNGFVCDWCERVFKPHRQRLRELRARLSENPKGLKFCSAECNNLHGKHHARAKKNKEYDPKVENSLTSQLLKKLEKTNFRCALSGVPLTPDTASLDHIVPVSKDGTHHIDNLQFVHHTINRMKTTLQQDEFVGWCVRVADYRKSQEQSIEDWW